ncbi:MAG TPA: hypothetical protein VKI44_05880 [Acetobacteraceae bacterium]|nr:hypothetical protein [Acetobacteraceae bacterium]
MQLLADARLLQTGDLVPIVLPAARFIHTSHLLDDPGRTPLAACALS